MAPASLTFSVQARPISKEEVGLLLGTVAENPFGRCHTLQNNSVRATGREVTHTDAALTHIVGRTSQWSVTLSGEAVGGEKDSLWFDLTQRTRGLTVSLTVKTDNLSSEYDDFLAYALRWVHTLPDVSSGRVSDAGCEPAAVHTAFGLDRPPACFTTHLRWVHFLAPKFYSLFLTREALLATPHAQINELQTGLVMLRLFDNPFAGARPETLERLRVTTEYLNKNDRFMKDDPIGAQNV